MPTFSELRIEVQREVQGLLALVDRQAPQRATEAETALWAGVLRLGVAMMTLFFAHQAAKWPTGLRYEVNGIHHEVEGADTVEIGTKFGKVSVLQPMRRRVDRPRSRRDMPMARVLGLPGGFTLPLVALVKVRIRGRSTRKCMRRSRATVRCSSGSRQKRSGAGTARPSSRRFSSWPTAQTRCEPFNKSSF